jgi:hypothetical protein
MMMMFVRNWTFQLKSVFSFTNVGVVDRAKEEEEWRDKDLLDPPYPELESDQDRMDRLNAVHRKVRYTFITSHIIQPFTCLSLL